MEKSKVLFWIFLDVLIALAAINLVFFVMPMLSHWKDSFAPARTLTVTAQGMTTATPDMAEISFSVVSQGANPQALSTSNDTKMAAITQFLLSQNIASSDIATTGYDLEPNYTYYNNDVPVGGPVVARPPTISGYTLTQTVQIKIRVLDDVATVLGGLAPLGVNQIGSVDYTFQDPDEFIDIARGDALSKAGAQASQMASAAGASLGEVVTITESSNVPYPQPVYAMATGANMEAAAPSTPTLSPGTQDVTDEVTVTYQLN